MANQELPREVQETVEKWRKEVAAIEREEQERKRQLEAEQNKQ